MSAQWRQGMTDPEEFRLLLTHMENWAAKKDRRFDPEMLRPLLELRAAYDGLGPTYWPGGSVDDLLLRLWPAKGSASPPDAETLTSSLDNFFRFLRNTGRMASGSASPDELRKEAKRAALRMAAATDDRANWSSGKILADFGKDLGIDLAKSADLDDAQRHLDIVQSAWNDLPVHERQRRMPHPGDEELSGEERAMAAYGTDDPVRALIRLMQYELPKGELPPARVTAPFVRASGLTARIQALRESVAPQRKVTSIGVLRPTDGREVFAELGLAAWDEQYGELLGFDARQDWRSSADCRALSRVWEAAAATGVIDIHTTVVRPRPWTEPDADGWVEFGIRAARSVLDEMLAGHGGHVGLLYAMFRSYARGCAKITWDEIADFDADWEDSSIDRRTMADRGVDLTTWALRRSRLSAFLLVDSGIYRWDDQGFQLTAFGDVFVARFLTQDPSAR